MYNVSLIVYQSLSNRGAYAYERLRIDTYKYEELCMWDEDRLRGPKTVFVNGHSGMKMCVCVCVCACVFMIKYLHERFAPVKICIHACMVQDMHMCIHACWTSMHIYT